MYGKHDSKLKIRLDVYVCVYRKEKYYIFKET